MMTLQECRATALQKIRKKSDWGLGLKSVGGGREWRRRRLEGDLLFMPITPQPSVDDMSQLCAFSEPAGTGERGEGRRLENGGSIAAEG
jgi:hypothetical protein